jgi:hypothetical protein
MQATDVVAIIGAVTGTIALIVTLYRVAREVRQDPFVRFVINVEPHPDHYAASVSPLGADLLPIHHLGTRALPPPHVRVLAPDREGWACAIGIRACREP